MLLRRFVPLAAILALAAPVVSGCGAEEKAGVGVAEAASATAKKGTATYTFTVNAQGLGLPGKIDLKASGVTSLTKPQMTMRMDVGPALGALGIPLPSALLDVRLDGGTVYVKPPAIPGLTIPGGKEWVSLDIAEAAESFGLDTAGLAPLFAYDPAAYLKLVNTAKGLKQVGEESINGTKTRHFRGTTTIEDSINALPADKQAAARTALDDVNKKLKLGDEFLTDPFPMNLWIDKDGVARRMSTSQSLPAEKGVPAGKIAIVYDLTKFGTKLDVSKPSSVFDATQPLLDAIKQFSGSGLLG